MINDLPVDILKKIIFYLPYDDCLNFKQTCWLLFLLVSYGETEKNQVDLKFLLALFYFILLSLYLFVCPL